MLSLSVWQASLLLVTDFIILLCEVTFSALKMIFLLTMCLCVCVYVCIYAFCVSMIVLSTRKMRRYAQQRRYRYGHFTLRMVILVASTQVYCYHVIPTLYVFQFSSYKLHIFVHPIQSMECVGCLQSNQWCDRCLKHDDRKTACTMPHSHGWSVLCHAQLSC